MRSRQIPASRFAFVWPLGLSLFFSAGNLHAAERYYLVMFGVQKGFNLPKNSHTCALFIKDASPAPLETVFISWLPEDMNVTILQRDPQVGVNLDLHATLQHFEDRGCRRVAPEDSGRVCAPQPCRDVARGIRCQARVTQKAKERPLLTHSRHTPTGRFCRSVEII